MLLYFTSSDYAGCVTHKGRNWPKTRNIEDGKECGWKVCSFLSAVPKFLVTIMTRLNSVEWILSLALLFLDRQRCLHFKVLLSQMEY